MPRVSRLDAPGVLHCIMIRSIERRKIFLNRRDQKDFLDRLAILWRVCSKSKEYIRIICEERG